MNGHAGPDRPRRRGGGPRALASHGELRPRRHRRDPGRRAAGDLAGRADRRRHGWPAPPVPGWPGCRAGPVTAGRSRPAACPRCCPAAARSPTPPARVDAATAWGVEALPETARPRRRRDRRRAARRRARRPGRRRGRPRRHRRPGRRSAPRSTAASFVVALELRETDVTRAADVVFPVAPVTDKAGTFVTWEGRPRPFDGGLQQPGLAARPAGPRRHRRGARRSATARSASAPSPRRAPRCEDLGPWDGERATGPSGRHAPHAATRARGRRPARWPPGSSCSTTARCRTATTTCAPPPARRSPACPRDVRRAATAARRAGERGDRDR